VMGPGQIHAQARTDGAAIHNDLELRPVSWTRC
jgi:hypothetical protein